MKAKVFNEDKAVGRLAEILALECGMQAKVARQIRVAAVLHDIGKQKIPTEILNKPGKLTADEFEVMKTHTNLGAAMLETVHSELGVMARTIARYHHEKWDGTGYWGKFLCELPPYVEIVAIADIFCALFCSRQYKDAWPSEDVLTYIEKLAGTHFNPALISIFIPLVQNDSRVAEIFEGR